MPDVVDMGLVGLECRAGRRDRPSGRSLRDASDEKRTQGLSLRFADEASPRMPVVARLLVGSESFDKSCDLSTSGAMLVLRWPLRRGYRFEESGFTAVPPRHGRSPEGEMRPKPREGFYPSVGASKGMAALKKVSGSRQSSAFPKFVCWLSANTPK